MASGEFKRCGRCGCIIYTQRMGRYRIYDKNPDEWTPHVCGEKEPTKGERVSTVQKRVEAKWEEERD